MAALIEKPAIINAAGNKLKLIEEFVGKVNSGDAKVSIARMKSPEGWMEPGQTPEFDEYTVVLNGTLRVELKDETLEIKTGQAVFSPMGEWVRYSSPYEEGAEYISVCIPAFSPDKVHRDEE